MNNEETRILNPQQPEQKAEGKNNVEQPAAEKQPEQKPADKKDAKPSNKKGAAFAAAAGGAVGAAAATGAQHLYDNMQAEAEEVEVEEVEEVEVASAAPVVEPKVVEEPIDVIPEDAKLEDPQDAVGTEGANTQSGDNVVPAGGSDTTSHESEVHVLGVDLVDDGEGGQMFVAALEDSVSGEQALVVDVDLDGTIDVLAVDENHNGQLENNEIYNVHDQGWQSEGYIDAYAQEQQMLQQQEEQNFIAAADENADFVNDADTGLFEA